MRRLMVVAIVALALVATFAAGAFARGQWYWSKGNALYKCEGTGTGVKCKGLGYTPAYTAWVIKNSAVDKGAVIVSYAGRAIFSCDLNWSPGGNCEYYGP